MSAGFRRPKQSSTPGAGLERVFKHSNWQAFGQEDWLPRRNSLARTAGRPVIRGHGSTRGTDCRAALSGTVNLRSSIDACPFIRTAGCKVREALHIEGGWIQVD